MSKGEKWMKDTASSCTVVGALIVTIMFATAFTVPGGNDQNNGFPIFLNRKLFMVFIVSDALSLFSSSTSVLMFLGILTSRYAEEDFLESLPRKMIIGLSTLFFSIVAMMTTFSTTLLLMLHEQSWILKLSFAWLVFLSPSLYWCNSLFLSPGPIQLTDLASSIGKWSVGFNIHQLCYMMYWCPVNNWYIPTKDEVFLSFFFSWKVTIECLPPIAYFFIFWFWTYYKSII